LTPATPVSLTQTPGPNWQIIHNFIPDIQSGSETGAFQIHHPLPYTSAPLASKACLQDCFDPGV
jgi:hypothetical protein